MCSPAQQFLVRQLVERPFFDFFLFKDALRFPLEMSKHLRALLIFHPHDDVVKTILHPKASSSPQPIGLGCETQVG